MTGLAVKRVRRQQLLREAEGYLDLALLFGEVWPSSTDSRQCLAQRCLQTLDRLGEGLRNAPAQYLRGQALRTLHRYEEAVGPLREAATLEPSDIHVWLALGWCYKRIGRIDLAIDALEEALEIDPGRAIILYNLACYWSLAGNRQQAIDYLSQAFAIDGHFRALVEDESDFDPIRDDPGFRALTSVVV